MHFFLQPLAAFVFFLLSSSTFAGSRPITPEPDISLNFNARHISVEEAQRLHDQGAVFCDTRLTREFILDTIPGALACLYEERGGMANRRNDFDASIETWHNHQITDRSRPLVVFCNAAGCWRSYKAAVVAAHQGYDVYWLRDGVPGWRAAGLPTVSQCPL